MDREDAVFTPSFDRRNSEIEARVHENLTETCRQRFESITSRRASIREIELAIGEMRDEYGYVTEIQEDDSTRVKHRSIILDASTEVAMSYLEILLNIFWKHSDREIELLLNIHSKIERTLIEQGILFRIKPSVSEIAADARLSRPHPGAIKEIQDALDRMTTDRETAQRDALPGRRVWFERLADGMIVEADQELQEIIRYGDEWSEPLEADNEAWNAYQNREFSYRIAEKLYNSIEAVLTKICVDLEQWEDAERGVGRYVEVLKEKSLFEPNEAMQAEWQQISSGIKIGMQKTGADRHRHAEMSQEYCLLLLHQVSAFLSFIIKRYEYKYSQSTE